MGAQLFRLGVRTGSMAVAAAGFSKVPMLPNQRKPFLLCEEEPQKGGLQRTLSGEKGKTAMQSLNRTRSGVVERSRSGRVDKHDTLLFIAYKKKFGKKKMWKKKKKKKKKKK